MRNTISFFVYISFLSFVLCWTFSCKNEKQQSKETDGRKTTEKTASWQESAKGPETNDGKKPTASISPQLDDNAAENPNTTILLQNKQKDHPSNVKNPPQQANDTKTNLLEPIIAQDYDSFFSLDTSAILFPDDFKIGPVQNTYNTRSDFVKINETVKDFFASLIKKEINKNLIEEQRRGLLTISLEHYLQSDDLAIKNYRLGAIHIDDNAVSEIKVRLFNDKTTTNGYIFLTKKDSLWLISDIQLNFLELSDKPAEKQDKFRPSDWSDFLF